MDQSVRPSIIITVIIAHADNTQKQSTHAP